jgi:hypothetical protein
MLAPSQHEDHGQDHRCKGHEQHLQEHLQERHRAQVACGLADQHQSGHRHLLGQRRTDLVRPPCKSHLLTGCSHPGGQGEQIEPRGSRTTRCDLRGHCGIKQGAHALFILPDPFGHVLHHLIIKPLVAPQVSSGACLIALHQFRIHCVRQSCGHIPVAILHGDGQTVLVQCPHIHAGMQALGDPLPAVRRALGNGVMPPQIESFHQVIDDPRGTGFME